MTPSSTMRAWFVRTSPTGAETELRDIARPAPGPKQLLVRMHAAALNRGELVAAKGPGNWKAMGTEGAGEVVALGPETTGFALGDRVMARCAGALAEFALMEQGETMRVPAALDWPAAGATAMTFLVAHDMLVRGARLRAGEWVLVNGVASGVGVSVLQLAKALGAKVIGTSGSQAKLDALAPLGLDLGLATRVADFSARVLDATDGRGADVIVNTVGGSVFAENVKSAAFEARLAIVGHVDRTLTAELDLEALHGKRLTVFGVSNKLRGKAQRAEGVTAFVADVMPLFEAGTLAPHVDRVVGFAELPAALTAFEGNQHVGKIVVTIG